MDWVTRLHGAVAGLKRLVRAGWRDRGVPEPESVAAHAFGVALLSLAEAERRAAAGEALDVLGVVRMALLHDLAESGTGDLTPERRRALFGPDAAAARRRQREAETRVLAELLAAAPEPLRDGWTATWTEYCEGRTPAARLVHDADRLDCLLQGARYREEGAGRRLDEFRRLLDEVEEPELRAAAERAWDGP